jgi:L-ascorbate metabolism protein UlaG (beta-lactamase superfamily)
MKRLSLLHALVPGLLAWGWTGSALAAEPPTLLFLGHEATLITSSTGTRILSDPYQDGSQAGFLDDLPKGLEADAVTISHPHPDHNHRSAVGAAAELINKAGTYQVGDIQVRVFNGREGSPKGPGMANRICVFDVGGVKFVHLGDSGIVTDPDILQAITHADVVLVSIDDYVIPIPKIMAFMAEIQARTVVPAHWEGPAQLDAFLKTVPAPYIFNQGGSSTPLCPGMPLQVLVMKPEKTRRE